MNKNTIENKSSQDLESELKKIKGITGVLIGALSVLFAITIYGLIAVEKKATFIALIAVAISLSAILPMQFSSMKKIKQELKLRREGS